MVLTVWRFPARPFFNKIVTGPVAFAQVISRVSPAWTAWKTAGPMVNWTALATARAAAAKRAVVNCILTY